MDDEITVAGETLESYLASHPFKGPFKIAPHYSIRGDMLVVYFKDDPAYAEQLTPQVTIERSFATKEIVGVKIFGVEWIMGQAELDANRTKSAV